MRRHLSEPEAMGIGIGALASILAAGLLARVRGEIDQANAALVLALVVIVAAATGGRRAGAITSVVAAASFDFFLTRPYLSLAIKSADDVITTGLLLVVGLGVGQIASSRHDARAAGRAGTADVAGLHRVASLTAGGADTKRVVEAVCDEVARALDLRTCRFEPGPTRPSVPELDADGRVAVPYVFRGDGFVLPEEGVAVAVREGPRVLGWLVGTPAAPRGVSRDRRRTALVLAEHLALTMAARDLSGLR